MKFKIKTRFSSNVIFTAYIPDDTAPDLRMRDALIIAVKSGCDLSDCDLSGCDLSPCDLSGCDLRGCNLSGCNLSGSDLSGCDLRGSDLRSSDLTPIRDDLWAVLCSAPAEVAGLKAALISGRIDGSTYEGDCACLVGTIANLRKVPNEEISGLKPNSSRPIERFFMAINKGDTPSNNQFSALAVEWIDQFLANMKSAFGEVQK